MQYEHTYKAACDARDELWSFIIKVLNGPIEILDSCPK